MNKTKIIPTPEQLQQYSILRKSGSIRRNTPLRFSKIILSTDSDLDG